MGSDRAELARLCSARNWSKAIRLLDSILVRSPSSIHDLWYGTLSPAPFREIPPICSASLTLTLTPPNSLAATGPSATPSSSSTSTSSRTATARCCSTPPCFRPTFSKVRFAYNCSPPLFNSVFCSSAAWLSSPGVGLAWLGCGGIMSASFSFCLAVD
jgi:hypothetical protein